MANAGFGGAWQFEVVRGRGAASGRREYQDIGGSIRAQAPIFERDWGLSLAGYHKATINAQLDNGCWRMLNPTHSPRAVHWLKGFPGENFDFADAAIRFRGKVYNALVYYPRPETKSAYSEQTAQNMIELLAPLIPDLRYGDHATLLYHPSQLQIVEDGDEAACKADWQLSGAK